MKQTILQSQKLQFKMNQSIMQSIHILQFTSMELTEYINELSVENPLIEEINYDYEFENYRGTQSNDMPGIGEINQAAETMYDKLKGQLVTVNYEKRLQPIIEYGIDSINEAGYLEIELERWAEDCSTSLASVKQALEIIQSLEPSGIGARSLSECIVLQLKGAPEFVYDLLENHLEWIAENDIDAITEHYQTTRSMVEELIENIRQCHPKPGALIDTKQPEFIIPEAAIYEENGEWNIKFFKWASPNIKINETYKNLANFGKEGEMYLKEKYKQIKWLQQAIGFRKNTLESIIRVIVEKQLSFFAVGADRLQALTLREIASEIDVHVSTVSRTIDQKYVQTPHGVLPIKFFLQSGIRQDDRKNMASTAIKQHILRLIKQEDKRKPLSDQALTNLLNEELEINIARRTVMKYREQMDIPSSTKRRKR